MEIKKGNRTQIIKKIHLMEVLMALKPAAPLPKEKQRFFSPLP
ncbi:hypothetical protein [Borreliella garinii]|uniref:Uncharacterized protein n=1 Tax=Borreliella garinii PBr TaxID=498743 RepID=B8F0Q8_BORGR|nr:hypothetical protein [Borreliella garinii]ACL34485.1 hypothetical protein BGAPBR_K0025 [Borreliella garinii PBr]